MLYGISMSDFRKTWKGFIHFLFRCFDHLWMGESVVFSFVCLHLRNIVHKVSWLMEQFKFLRINKVSQLIFNLNYQLNNVQAVKSMVSQFAIEGDTGLLGSSEVASHKWQHILLDLIICTKYKSILLLSGDILPHANLRVFAVFNGHQIPLRFKTQLILETSTLNGVYLEVLAICAAAETYILAWFNHFAQFKRVS